MLLPVLHIQAEGPQGLLLVNGSPAGQSDRPPVTPVAPDGTVFITYLPLGRQGDTMVLPLTVALPFAGGRPSGPADGCIIYAGKDGRVDVELQPLALPFRSKKSSPYAVGTVNFSHNGQPHTATAYWEDGLHVAVEQRQRERAELLYTAEDFDTCAISIGQGFTQTDIVLKGEGKKGPRTVVIAPGPRGFAVMLDEYATGESRQGGMVCTKPLGDICGHEKRYGVLLVGGQLRRGQEEIGFFTQTRRQPATAQLCCKAFCEALALGLWEETLSMMTDDLAGGMERDELEAFFGAFAHVREIRGDENPVLWLAEPLFENGYALKAFAFEMEGKKIANIRPL